MTMMVLTGGSNPGLLFFVFMSRHIDVSVCQLSF